MALLCAEDHSIGCAHDSKLLRIAREYRACKICLDIKDMRRWKTCLLSKYQNRLSLVMMMIACITSSERDTQKIPNTSTDIQRDLLNK